MPEHSTATYPVGPPPQSGYVSGEPLRKTWSVTTASSFGTTIVIEAEEVRYGNGLIEFITNAEITDLFNLDQVVSVRTVTT